MRQVSRWINDSSPQRIFACSLVTVYFLSFFLMYRGVKVFDSFEA